jgi:tetratricopeptide (TPR) repeat protein
LENEQIRHLAGELRKQQKYDEALQQYEILWTQSRSECTEWDGWGFAQCLRKTGRVKEALEICREVYKMKSDFEYIRSLYGWCVYDLEMKKPDEDLKKDESSFFKAAKAITDLTSPGQYSPYIRTIFRVVDYLKDNRQNYPAQNILEWLAKVAPGTLSTECGTGFDEEGKPIEYSSDVEKWYAEQCKALLKIGRFEECIQIGEEALSILKKFHTDNDLWFKYRIALANGKLGNKEEAITSLIGISSRKKDWFILMDIAELYFSLSNLDLAMKFAAEAALTPGQKELSFRWELYMLLGEILKAQSKLDLAKDHILLALKLRQEKEWEKIPPNLSSLITELEVKVDDPRSSIQIQRSLIDSWKDVAHADQKQMSGKIKNLVGEGRSGFIYGDDGKDYYFKIKSFQRRPREVVVGIRVKFFVQPATDGRCDSAVELELI